MKYDDWKLQTPEQDSPLCQCERCGHWVEAASWWNETWYCDECLDWVRDELENEMNETFKNE